MVQNITDNKTFWQTVKPFLSDKSNNKNKITLIENEEVISNDGDLSEIFNSLFANVTKELNINKNKDLFSNNNNINDPLESLVDKYKYHPSIQAIRDQNIHTNSTFTFSEVIPSEIKKVIKQLDTNKATQITDIPTKIIKTNDDIFSDFIASNIKLTLSTARFPSNLKKADIIPVIKKRYQNSQK